MASSTLQSETLTDFDRGMLKTIMVIHDWDRNFTAIHEIFLQCDPSPAVAHAYWLALKPNLHGSVKVPDGES